MQTSMFNIDSPYVKNVATLASRMRPQKLQDVFGQQHILGEGTWLCEAIKNDTLSSIILYGPAGTGKTSIAHVIANATNSHFVEVSAIGGTVKDLRREIENASQALQVSGKRTILFVDEIHRFTKTQQDALLHAVEDNIVTLIGATTENPFFEVNTALNSRSHILELAPLSDVDIKAMIENALTSKNGLDNKYELEDDALNAIIIMSGGDGRTALNTLELAAQVSEGNDDKHKNTISAQNVQTAVPNRKLPYDKDKDMHYDIISAFIKSMRGSDPDGAVYWMARMLAGGEDPKFIARRILIAASEDVGNADPQAICVAAAAFKAVEVIGLPECRINLAQAATYVAMAPKSNASVNAIAAAESEVKNGPVREVPHHLRDRHRPGSDSYPSYDYPHNHDTG